MKTVSTVLLFTLFVVLTACRKNNEESVSYSKSCDAQTEVLTNGKCVLKPEYNRFGRFTFFRDNPLWVTTSGCSSIDSAAIAFKVDTLSGSRYSFILSFEEYQQDKSGTVMNESLSEGADRPSFFPDATRGDSVCFILRTENFDMLGNVYQQRVGKFYGRFDLQHAELRGRVAFLERLDGPATGDVCESVVFRPFR